MESIQTICCLYCGGPITGKDISPPSSEFEIAVGLVPIKDFHPRCYKKHLEESFYEPLIEDMEIEKLRQTEQSFGGLCVRLSVKVSNFGHWVWVFAKRLFEKS